MKFISKFFTLALVASLLFACGGVEGDKATTTAPKNVAQAKGDAYKMGKGSLVVWQGSKPTGNHDGTILIKDGTLTMDGNNITAGSFVMDMTSLAVTDLNGENKTKLEGHLKSGDFFEVDKYQTAKFDITSADQLPNDNTATHLIKGNLTMKGVTKNVEFKAIVNLKGDQVLATTPNFTIDRSEWSIKYGSKTFFPDIADKIIKDRVGLAITLRGTKQ